MSGRGHGRGHRPDQVPRTPSSPHTHVRLVLLSVEDPQQRWVLVPPEIQRDIVDGCDCEDAGVSQAASLAHAGPRGSSHGSPFLWVLVFKLGI